MINKYNSFEVNRMMVFQKKHCSLDVEFKSGLNIIHGSNSAGKSSLLDTLAHSLGAESIIFPEIVTNCSHVLTEVVIANNKITLQREISNSSRLPISIFYGDINSALLSHDKHWHQFPFNSFNEKFGFSKIFFDFLNYPETVSSDTTITTNQLLRLLYADQTNNHLPIFRYEKWDNSEKRTAIRDYIFGLFSGELYSLQIQKRSADKQLSDSIHRLESIFKILGKTSEQMIEEFILQEKFKLQSSKEIILERIFDLQNSNIASQNSQDISQKKIQNELSDINKSVLSLEVQIQAQELEVLDLESFRSELRIRMIDLNNSIHSNKLLQDIFFDYCPSCHSKIKPSISINNTCSLCKEETSNNINESNLLQLKTELNFHIQETNKILADDKKNLDSLKNTYKEKTIQLNEKKQEFTILTNKWHTSLELDLIENYRELGKIDSELKNIDKRLEIAQEIKSLEDLRDEFQKKSNDLDTNIKLMINQSKNKLRVTLDKLNIFLKNLLEKDIGIQKEFFEPNSLVEVVFEDNEIKVNGASHFSQSSTVVLRQLFHLSLIMLADSDSSIRLPRFLILDGINDGGLEKCRAANLQKIIYETCLNLKQPFQVICATSELFIDFTLAHKIEYLNGKRTFS